MNNPITFTVKDLIDFNVWVPANELTKTDYNTLRGRYIESYQVFITEYKPLGILVAMCFNMFTNLKFMIISQEATETTIINYIKKIITLFSNILPSQCGSDEDIKEMLNKLS